MSEQNDKPTADTLPSGTGKPLSDSLLGDAESGGLAGQGGMVPEDIDRDDDEDAG